MSQVLLGIQSAIVEQLLNEDNMIMKVYINLQYSCKNNSPPCHVVNRECEKKYSLFVLFNIRVPQSSRKFIIEHFILCVLVTFQCDRYLKRNAHVILMNYAYILTHILRFFFSLLIIWKYYTSTTFITVCFLSL